MGRQHRKVICGRQRDENRPANLGNTNAKRLNSATTAIGITPDVQDGLASRLDASRPCAKVTSDAGLNDAPTAPTPRIIETKNAASSGVVG